MMDIDTMEAGREMDALVAERVMGWRHPDTSGHNADQMLPPDWVAWNDIRSVPPFSTDIAAAWQVLEKFLPHVRVECHKDSDYTDGTGWHADIWADSGHGCSEGASTAPVAICRAALKAVEPTP